MQNKAALACRAVDGKFLSLDANVVTKRRDRRAPGRDRPPSPPRFQNTAVPYAGTTVISVLQKRLLVPLSIPKTATTTAETERNEESGNGTVARPAGAR